MTHVVDPELRPFYIAVYGAILEAWLDHGIAPSQQELCRACQCSGATVINALKELKRKGYIVWPKHQVRSVKPTDLERTISREPPDPWAELVPKKFFKASHA